MALLGSPGNFKKVFQSRDGLSGFTETIVVEKGHLTRLEGHGRKIKQTELCGNYWKMIEIT